MGCAYLDLAMLRHDQKNAGTQSVHDITSPSPWQLCYMSDVRADMRAAAQGCSFCCSGAQESFLFWSLRGTQSDSAAGATMRTHDELENNLVACLNYMDSGACIYSKSCPA